MFTINAKDARQLQKSGIDQDELLANAADRCQAAIVNSSRSGCMCVEIAVANLTDDSFTKLVNALEKRGFTCTNQVAFSEKTRALTVGWEK